MSCKNIRCPRSCIYYSLVVSFFSIICLIAYMISSQDEILTQTPITSPTLETLAPSYTPTAIPSFSPTSMPSLSPTMTNTSDTSAVLISPIQINDPSEIPLELIIGVPTLVTMGIGLCIYKYRKIRQFPIEPLSSLTPSLQVGPV